MEKGDLGEPGCSECFMLMIDPRELKLHATLSLSKGYEML